MIEEKNPGQSRAQTNLKLVFPLVFSERRKDNSKAIELYEAVKDYLSNPNAKVECIMTSDKDRKKLLSKLGFTKKTLDKNKTGIFVEFVCEYGCSLIISKEKQESSISVLICSPEQWSSGSSSSKAGRIEICEPKNQCSIYTPQLTEYEKTLPEFIEKFQKGFAYSKEKAMFLANSKLPQGTVRQQKFNPEEIQKIVKMSFEATTHQFSKFYSPKKALEEKDEEENQQQKLKKTETIGTHAVDFGKSDVNLSWYVAECTIRKLLTSTKKQDESRYKCNKLIIGFKASLLHKAVLENKDTAKRTEIVDYKRCLDEIIFFYKKQISPHAKQHCKFLDIIKEIHDLIIQANGGKMSAKIQELMAEVQENFDISKHGVAKILVPEPINHRQPQFEEAKIIQHRYEIDTRLPFESLIQMYEQNIKKIKERQQSQIIKEHMVQFFIDHWVLLVEKTIFNIAYQISQLDGEKPTIDLLIHMREIQCEIGASNLCKLALLYEDEIKKKKVRYGMEIEAQANSHIELVKLICSVIAFESVKMNRQRKKSNLNEYRIPLDVDLLFKYFVSHSRLARRAMTCMHRYYINRMHLKPLFLLNGDCSSFNKFGALVGEQTRSAHVWIAYMEEMLRLKKSIIVQTIKLQEANARLSNLEYIKSYILRYGSYQNSDAWKEKTISTRIEEPLLKFSVKDKWLYAFVNNIPPDVLGLMKILAFSQNPRSSGTVNTKINNLQILNSPDSISRESFPICIHSRETTRLNSRQVSSFNISIDKIGYTNPQNDIKILFGEQDGAKGYTTEIYEEKNYFKKKIQSQGENSSHLIPFIDLPADKKMDREHAVYSSLINKPVNIEIEQFLSLFTTRVGEKTEIVALCNNIINRKVIANCYDTGYRIHEQVFLQTAGHISSYNHKTEEYFGIQKKLLKELANIWIYSDVNFAPILGPFTNYLIMELIDNGLPELEANEIKETPYKIAIKCLEEFERGEKQLADNPQMEIQWDQRFIVMAAICCFREVELVDSNEKEILLLAKLIFQNRTCKIFSDREERPNKKREFEQEKQFYIQKAVFSNIKIISDYFNEHNDKLNELLKVFDEAFPDDIEWERIELYEYKGKSDKTNDFYQIDMYRGSIFKNGKELAALDPKIKASPYYKQIFGETREFQVFPSISNFFLRTKNNLNYRFKIDPKKYQIYFQFSQDGTSIQYIVRKAPKIDGKYDEQIWQLLPREEIKKSFVHFPKIFVDNHIAWFCRQKNCIVFRKSKFQQLYEIGLVVHVRKYSPKELQIVKALHVVYHGSYENQDLDSICDINNELYEQLILRSKEKKLSEFKPYKCLQKIQKSPYIFQLKNQKTDEVHFLMHRYQLRFKLIKNQLVSQSHYGYYVDDCYYDIKSCIFNKFPCLVLRKDPNNQMILNSHRRIVVISDGQVQEDGVINNSGKASIHINSFKYDIHDFFDDIRGATRQSQLHLASIMVSIDDNIRMRSMEMTPLEYGMHVLKSCFTNKPFSRTEEQKFKNLLKLANDEMLLLCEVLWKGSQQLAEILSFKLDESSSGKHMLSSSQVRLLQSRSLYEKKLHSQRISFRQKLLPNMENFLGGFISEAEDQKNNHKEDEGSSSSSSDCDFEKNELYWKNMVEYRGDGIVESVDKIEGEYKKLCELSEQLNQWKKNSQMQVIEGSEFPKIIQQYAIGNNKSVMMKEMIEEIQNSYNCFIEDEGRLVKIANEFSGERKDKNMKKIQQIMEKATQILKQIDHMIEQVIQQNESHPDLVSNFRPTISKACYTRLLCYDQQILSYFPNIEKKAAKKLKQAIQIWMDLKTKIASLERVRVLLTHPKVDLVALLREIGSPRNQVFKNTPWICFEAQMKIQIWPSQLETYQNLMSKSKDGPYCQLNMGQGKTQVIIPMIILNTIFNKSNCLPRINLLTSLYEEARGNMFRFLSATGFQIPGFEIPFTRKIRLTKTNIFAVRDLMNCFSGRAYLLVNRESRLSQILKYNQVVLQNPQSQISLQSMPLLNGQIFDIFDEVDAMMTPKKSYIFSIGDREQLPSANIRLKIIIESIEVFLRVSIKKLMIDQLATSDETEEEALRIISQGGYPSGLRITFENARKEQISEWKEQIVKIILRNQKNHYFSFITKLGDGEFEHLVKYCIDPIEKLDILTEKVAKASYNQIFILRGLFAYGILQHCLSKRCGVDYGVPGPEHEKKIAVPYEAADIPSKTSQYEHPEVSAILSLISYNMRGLSEAQFGKCLESLLSLTPSSMENEYAMWIEIMNEEDRASLVIDKARKINVKSMADKMKLFEIFKKNRKTIAFWLTKRIFPRDLVQYKENISSSSFDLADVAESVGFSGTMDNRWILPNQIKFMPCPTPSIKGTDGKMVYLVTKYTKQICVIEETEQPLWQRLIDLALKKETGCLIDVGAICVGKSLKDQIVPWIAEHKYFNHKKYVGISFCDDNGKWQVYDIQGKYYINRGTTIPDHQTFVIFDEARTRGADLKMDADVVAALSLGPDLTKDKLMQAAGRLRKLGRNQSIIILATHEVFSTLPTFPNEIQGIRRKLEEMETKDITELILAWCLHNTIHENENLLLQYLNLGWRHVYSKVHSKPLKQQLYSELKDKYEAALQTKMISEISSSIAKKKGQGELENSTGQFLIKQSEKYGQNVEKQAGALDDVCQREVEAEKDIEKQQEDGFYELSPIPEVQKEEEVNVITNTGLKFCKSFLMTNNFIKTTKYKCSSYDMKLNEGSNEKYNQLPICYFAQINHRYIKLLSIRQASIFLNKNILKEERMRDSQLRILSQMSIRDNIIKDNNLEEALVQAKFVAGHENFNDDEIQHLKNFFIRSLKQRGRVLDQDARNKDYMNIVSIILKLRRTHIKKFSGSSLEKMITILANENL